MFSRQRISDSIRSEFIFMDLDEHTMGGEPDGPVFCLETYDTRTTPTQHVPVHLSFEQVKELHEATARWMVDYMNEELSGQQP